MFIYLTGEIDSASTFDLFIQEEKELRKQGYRVNSLINYKKTISDSDYRRQRIKNVIKADKLIVIGSNYEDMQIERLVAEYLSIKVENYDKN